MSPGTTYYVRAYATNSEGTSYGDDLTFTTSSLIPTIATTAISNITSTSAETGGNVTSDGGASVTARGVCWSTSANPIISDSHTSDGSGAGSFVSSISGLNARTTYHVRAYANNSEGTAYGSDVTFTTLTPGALTVNLAPQGAVDAGGMWKVGLEGDWQANGATLSDLEDGKHTLYFKDVDGWVPPAMRTVTLISGESTEISAVYFQETGRIPDTGQTKCYDNENEIPCPGIGEAFYGQDGSYLINPPSYTKLDANGDDLPDTAAEWVMVRDNVTGLIWEVKQDKDGLEDYSNPHDADNTYTWYDSNPATNGGNSGTPGNGTDTEDFLSALNAATYGTYSDWRIPTFKELASIVNLSRQDPAIDTGLFPNSIPSPYWSSTSTTGGYNAWYVDFLPPSVYDLGYKSKSNHSYVRAVRGAQSRSVSSLFVNGDGTVTDSSKGLMWQQENSDAMTDWKSAIAVCQALSLAGYNDWKLPTRIELHSIVNYDCNSPAIAYSYFPSTPAGAHFWSSTTDTGSPTGALVVHFTYGQLLHHEKAPFSHFRAVRGGEWRIPDNLIAYTPVQGSAWEIGNVVSITWDNAGIGGNVAISISRQGGKGGTFETIIASTENDGRYEWTTTGPESVNCVLKIEPLTDPSKATSQGLFTLYGPTPTVSSIMTSSITTTSATSGGNVLFDGGTPVAARGVCWSTSANPTLSDSHTSDGTGNGSFTRSLTGLTPGTTYHVRAYATNSAGMNYGADLTFTTSTTTPTVTTTSASSITHNSTSSGGNVTSDGGASITARGVCWSTSANPTTADSHTTDGTGTGSFSSSITGLSPSTTYHVRAYATNSQGTAYGADLTFTTSATTPTVTTTAASSITYNSASSGGNVTSDGGASTTARGVCWSTSANPTTADSKTADGTGAGNFTSSITGLNPSTTYHVRSYATNSQGTAYGSDITFTTAAAPVNLPNVSTTSVTSISSTSAASGGSVTNDGGASITARGVCWSTSADPTISDNHTSDGTGTGTYNSSITGLSPSTTYHVRAYATNSQGTAYGSDITFTTSTAAGSLTVTLAPQGAVTAGVKWKVGTGGAWQDNGATLSELGEEDHTLYFKDVDGWIPPAMRTVTIVAEQNTHFSSVYTQETGRIPDTGQMLCYENSQYQDPDNPIPCPGPGEDFYGQDASYLINAPSYSKLDVNGNELPDSSSAWAMVRDNITGLIWEVKTENDSIHDEGNLYTWEEAESVFVDQINNENFGGHSDWRLPTARELSTILDLATGSNTIDTVFFIGDPKSHFYWSSDSLVDPSHDHEAWGLDTDKGSIFFHPKTYQYNARCVRGGPFQSSTCFVNNGDSTVTDPSTGLMWSENTANGSYTWKDAVAYAESANLAGYSDWRLPTLLELYSTVDISTHDPAINLFHFADTASVFYLSSTVYPGFHTWSRGSRIRFGLY